MPLIDPDLIGQLSALYVGYFGRAGYVEGLDYWLDRYESALADGPGQQDTLTWIAENFRRSDEAIARFPVLAPASDQALDRAAIEGFLDAAYTSLFNRDPDPAGRAYWTDEILRGLEEDGEMGTALVDIISGAQNAGDTAGGANDAATIRNKIQAAEEITETLVDFGVELGGEVAVGDVRPVIDGVQDRSSTLEDARPEVAALVPVTPAEDTVMSPRVTFRRQPRSRAQIEQDATETAQIQPGQVKALRTARMPVFRFRVRECGAAPSRRYTVGRSGHGGAVVTSLVGRVAQALVSPLNGVKALERLCAATGIRVQLARKPAVGGNDRGYRRPGPKAQGRVQPLGVPFVLQAPLSRSRAVAPSRRAGGKWPLRPTKSKRSRGDFPER